MPPWKPAEVHTYTLPAVTPDIFRYWLLQTFPDSPRYELTDWEQGDPCDRAFVFACKFLHEEWRRVSLNEFFAIVRAVQWRADSLTVIIREPAGGEIAAWVCSFWDVEPDTPEVTAKVTAKVGDVNRKPGRRRLKVNVWARAEHAKGRTIDELLPEYERRHKKETDEELAEPRRSLSAALGDDEEGRNRKK